LLAADSTPDPAAWQRKEASAELAENGAGAGPGGLRFDHAKKVRAFIVRRSPKAVCDHCIKDKLLLPSRAEVSQKTRKLQIMPGFDRRDRLCSMCKRGRMSISYAPVPKKGDSAGMIVRRAARSGK
jgi:hypothetical protein